MNKSDDDLLIRAGGISEGAESSSWFLRQPREL